MSRQSSLVKNTLIIAVGRVATQFIAFFLLPLYTYFLSPAEFGLVDLAVTYLTLLVPTLTLQLEMASFRFLVDARSSEAKRASVISNIVYMVVPLVLPIIILFTLYGVLFNFEYFDEMLLAGLALLLSNLFLQIARGLGDNKNFAIASIVIGLTTAATAVLFIAYLGMRVEGMLLSIAAANILGAFFLFMRLRLYRYMKLGLRDKALQREILGYSIPLVPNGAAWWVINVSDRTIITIMISAAANGIYAVSSKYASVFSSIFSIFSMSWTESASLHIDAKDRDKFFSSVSNSAVRLFGALGLGLIAAIPFIFPWLVNESFGEAYLYVPILVVAAFFNAVVGLYSAVYIAKKLTKQVMNTSLIAAGLNIVLTIGLIPFFGLYAAAAATAIAFLAMAIFRHYDVKKYVKITYEKNVFIILGFLYVVVGVLYYMDAMWASVAGLAVAVAAGYWLNRSEMGKIKAMLLKRLTKKNRLNTYRSS